MSSVSIFSGSYCGSKAIIRALGEMTGYRLLGDEEIVARTSCDSELPVEKIRRSFSSKISIFNQFTLERERSIAWLRYAVARYLEDDHLLIHGFSGLLVPSSVSHVLRVCLIADLPSRIANAVDEGRLSEKDAARAIKSEDEDRAAWTDSLYGMRDPWDASLYDILIPTDKLSPEGAVAVIFENLKKAVVRTTDASRQATRDFQLASDVGVALAQEGHAMPVAADRGTVTITINKHVILLKRLEDELEEIASGVVGVDEVKTEVGEGFHQADVYRKADFQMPTRVLLVDDEREFVQTLSERLLMRDMGSAVAYDGESALSLVEEEEPEVMILDLKMPGIDGIEVLRQVKASRPEIEVIILTGHGSDADRELCLELGAFAYLQKPVDIDVLSETLRRANDKTRANLGAKARVRPTDDGSTEG